MPVNFTITISGGSLLPDTKNYSIILNKDSLCRCAIYNPSIPDSDNQKEYTFTLSEDQKELIWIFLEDRDFFSLDPNYIDTCIDDGYYIEIEVTSTEISHAVIVQNKHIEEIENFISLVNSFLPPDYQLKY